MDKLLAALCIGGLWILIWLFGLSTKERLGQIDARRDEENQPHGWGERRDA